MFAPSFFDQFEDRLNLAVYDINHGYTDMATIAEQLKAARAQLAEARQGASSAVAESASASSAVLVEVNKVLKEASDLRAEVAELTNGGPPLEDHVTQLPPPADVALHNEDTGAVERLKLSN